jgi:hypothetical protein
MAIEFSHLRLRIRYWTFGVNKSISERQSQTGAKGDLRRGLQAHRFGGCQRQNESLHQFEDLRLSHVQLLLILHRRTKEKCTIRQKTQSPEPQWLRTETRSPNQALPVPSLDGLQCSLPLRGSRVKLASPARKCSSFPSWRTISGVAFMAEARLSKASHFRRFEPRTAPFQLHHVQLDLVRRLWFDAEEDRVDYADTGIPAFCIQEDDFESGLFGPLRKRLIRESGCVMRLPN